MHPTDPELEAMRRKIGRIEADLISAKESLGRLESTLFGLGLFLRARIYLMFGLLGLVLCVPRIFLIDLNSTLHRIVAFVVLGVVLLWVGFSYHRFRHLVTGESKPPQER